MTSTTRLSLILAIVLFVLLLFPRRRLHPRAPLDNVLDHLVARAVSEARQLSGIASTHSERHILDRNRTHSKPDSLALKLCALLSGKRLLFVGSDTTYHLHSLWLSALQPLEKRSHQCLGRDFCTFHHICRLPFHGLPPSTEPPARKKKIPSRQTLLLDNSSLLIYSLSSTLYPSLDKQDPAYIYPQVDPYTQVRQSNSFWRRQARKSDIVVINRPPIPAPASTYPNGNWTYAQSLCMQNNYLVPLACDDTFENNLINAAIHATVKHFLPSLFDTLGALSVDPEMKNTRLLWHSNWYIQPFCAKSGLPDFVPLLQDIFFSAGRNALIDPWSYYYNAQGEYQTC